MQPLKTYFNWSSGKDSALALYYLLKDKNYSIESLVTTINKSYNRISMHGIRKELLIKQSDAIGIPCHLIELSEEPSMTEYEMEMKKNINFLRQNNFEYAAFGDIFLEDLKKYREEQLAPFNIRTVFPLWKKDTSKLIHEFIESGFKAIVVCVDSNLLNSSFAGRIIDNDFIKDLPSNVDVCGENGEFHTFCFDGPVFKTPVSFTLGEKIYREYKAPKNNKDNNFSVSKTSDMGFWFCDLLPGKD